jgi:CBS domain-containing protein
MRGAERTSDVCGERTPFAAGSEWPTRVDAHLGVSESEVERWVQSACVLCSNGCGLDIAVANGRIVGVRGRAQDRVNHGRLGPKGLYGWQANNSPERLTRPRVDDAMVRRLTVHGASATVRELRTFFDDDHVHMALLVDRGRLIGTVERDDLPLASNPELRAAAIARLGGRTISADAAASEALETMKRTGRRRLAVTSRDGTLLGLLCLKASGLGFCSEADVASRNRVTASACATRWCVD